MVSWGTLGPWGDDSMSLCLRDSQVAVMGQVYVAHGSESSSITVV